MSLPLTTSEKTLLHYWLADGAPGFIRSLDAFSAGIGISSLQSSDFTTIGNLDNDILRGYLTAYVPLKETILNNVISAMNSQISANQNIIASAQADLAAITISPNS